MAKLSITIDRLQLQKALNQRIASLRRETKKPGQNPLVIQILEKDIDHLVAADLSIKE